MGNEDYVGGSTMMAEPELAFQHQTLFYVVVQTVKKEASKDFPGDVQQGDASMVFANLAVTFLLIEMDEFGVPEILETSPRRHIS
ncbi:hypothetical protein SprV_0100395100 [Sparganum proliferum]